MTGPEIPTYLVWSGASVPGFLGTALGDFLQPWSSEGLCGTLSGRDILEGSGMRSSLSPKASRYRMTTSFPLSGRWKTWLEVFVFMSFNDTEGKISKGLWIWFQLCL